MVYELKNGQGSLFVNDRKTEPSQPDYTGNCMVEGTKYQLSAWIKKPEGKKSFLSVTIRLPYKREVENQPVVNEADLPF
jgi:hypothetical protein